MKSAFSRSGGAVALFLIAACGGGDDASPGGHDGASGASGGSSSPTALVTDTVGWNAAMADVGSVAAVADVANGVVIFSDSGVHVLIGGAESAHVTAPTTWRSAAHAVSPDGIDEVLAIGGDGHVYEVRDLATVDDVSDRYGLASDDVQAIAWAGGSAVAFALTTGIALADGTNVTRYDIGALTSFVGSTGRFAGLDGAGHVVLFEATTGESSFSVTGATAVAFDGNGKVVVATPAGLYAEDGGGNLEPKTTTTTGAVAGSMANVWFTMGTELGVYDGANTRHTTGLGVAPGALLFPSVSGDVWLVSAGALTRYSAAGQAADEQLWVTTVQPISAKVCASCHLPNGQAGITLSTYDDWVARRAKVHDRVAVVKNMPPTGYIISDDDRATIDAWATMSAAAGAAGSAGAAGAENVGGAGGASGGAGGAPKGGSGGAAPKGGSAGAKAGGSENGGSAGAKSGGSAGAKSGGSAGATMAGSSENGGSAGTASGGAGGAKSGGSAGSKSAGSGGSESGGSAGSGGAKAGGSSAGAGGSKGGAAGSKSGGAGGG